MHVGCWQRAAVTDWLAQTMSGVPPLRLFYYSKNAQRAGAFELLGGNYFVSPDDANTGFARSAPHAFVCAGPVTGQQRR